MDILVTALKRAMEKYDGVVIYGCGKVAKETYSAVLKCGIKPMFCVVSQKHDSDFFDDGVPVYEFAAQVEFIRENNILVIIGVSSLYEKEIEEIIQNCKIKRYLLISDFERFKMYENMSAQECLEEIAEWYADSYLCEAQVKSRKSIYKELKNAVTKEKAQDKIVFAMGALTPRVLKVAEALQERGYRIKLVVNPIAVMQEFCLTGLKKMNLTYERCVTLEEFLYRIIIEGAKVVHLFTNLANSEIDRILIKNKELFPPIVYDEYDIYNLCYEGMPQNFLDNERFCLEHADGVCNRGYEIKPLIENGFDIAGRTIQFHDYCSNDQISYMQEEKAELSICYVGGIFSANESMEWADSFLECAELCAEHGCHFHVYPFVWNEVRLADYIELDKNCDYFHLHQPVLFEQLKYELSQYDYGIFPIKREYFERGLFLKSGQSITVYKKEELMYATGNKYFDYLDAGLPIIAACPKELMLFLETKGVVLNWAVEEYDFDEMKKRKRELKKKVLEEHHGLQMRQHIDELIDFYGSLSRKGMALENE